MEQIDGEFSPKRGMEERYNIEGFAKAKGLSTIDYIINCVLEENNKHWLNKEQAEWNISEGRVPITRKDVHDIIKKLPIKILHGENLHVEITDEGVIIKENKTMDKNIKDMDFVEIMDLLDEKEFTSIQFDRINKPFDSWEQFLEEYANGEEVHKQWMGMHEFTFIWKGQEKYPFAYAFPKLESEDGFYFYTQQN